MSKDSCSWSSNNEYCSSSKKEVEEVATAESGTEPLGIQDSMLNMNIGHSKTMLLHKNGSWLRSAQDAHFLSPPPPSSSSSSSSSSNGSLKSLPLHSHIVKPARLRLTHQNSAMNQLHHCDELMQTNHQDISNGRVSSRKRLVLKKVTSDLPSTIPQPPCSTGEHNLLSDSISESGGVGGAGAAAGKPEGVADKEESVRWCKPCSWILIFVIVLMLSLFLNVIFVMYYLTLFYS